MCTVDNCVWCHKAQIGGGFSQRPCSAFMTLCNAQCLHLFIVILHCADFMAAAATCPVMFSTFSIPHPVAWQNRGCMVCRQPACGYGGFVSTHSNLKESKNSSRQQASTFWTTKRIAKYSTFYLLYTENCIELPSALYVYTH